jgi:phenylacetate-coenzyme A ligase PaaK-like adenylate-forming protein
MTPYDELRLRHAAQAAARLPAYAERLEWPRERILAQRETDLRRLVRAAIDRSPWHRRRLAHIDPDRLTEADLGRVPPMTKDDLMSSFDTIVTDRRVSLGTAEAHLEGLETDAYLLDEFHVLASGGSSGRRGVFVYDWDAWLVCCVAYMRHMARTLARLASTADGPFVRASIAAARASHMTAAIGQTFSDPTTDHAFPVTLPLADIVAGLNRVRPTLITGYASVLLTLAHEARAGRLCITPRLVVASSEPLLPEMRATLGEVWHVPVINTWGTTEAGCTAIGCGIETGMHVTDDLVILEPVDARGEPVPPGERSAKVYVTNLFNHALPLIRYEVTDEVVAIDEPCLCGLAFGRVADILGRLDDTFVYEGGTAVHPHVFRSLIGCERSVVEYQVRQTPRGAGIALRVAGPLDTGGLERRLAVALDRQGLSHPEVTIALVDGFARTAVGKLQRFIPLPRA